MREWCITLDASFTCETLDTCITMTYILHEKANTQRCPHASLMLDRRLRRRPNMKLAWGQPLVFAWI